MSEDSLNDVLRCVQLDEDIDAPHLVKACEAEGYVRAFRFPKNLRNNAVKDPEVLQALLPKGNLFLTIDDSLLDDHSQFIPDEHPGILIVAQNDETVGTITTHIAQKIIRQFKDDYSEWHKRPWDNSVVRICPSSVEAGHLVSGLFVRDMFALRDEPDWSTRLSQVLRQNADNNPMGLPLE